MATDSIGEGGRNCCDAGDTHKEDAIEHRCVDANICDFAGASSKEALFLLRFSIKSHQERPGDIEALGHCARHSCIEIKGFSGQRLDSLTYPLSRQEKHGQEKERDNSNLPRENEHRRHY